MTAPWKRIACLTLLFAALPLQAQPSREQMFELFGSIVRVTVEFADGSTGTGSGVVIDGHYVATNCHVLAGARGVNVTKIQQSYAPIALKADWKHDLCLLRFDSLPMTPVPMRDSSTLQYEQPIFSISYPGDNNVPQPSSGTIKAIYPYDGSVIVRSSAAFALGSSGGALFDEEMNLIGITTFKSPGRQGFFYSLPVEWIRRLLDTPDAKLSSAEAPFWSLPEQQRPFFMQVVTPYQQQQWAELQRIARAWTVQESDNADAHYYLGMAQHQQQQTADARLNLNKAVSLNARHLGALVQLGIMATETGDKAEAMRISAQIAALDADEAQALDQRIAKMP